MNNEILFHILDSNEIGYLNVVFTPKNIFEEIKTISQLSIYDTEILKKYQLQKIEPSVFIHTGNFDKNVLSNALISEGFIEKESFSLHCNFMLYDEYIIKDENELKILGLL